MKNTKKTHKETIFEQEHRLKHEARDLSIKFKNVKPTKYLLK